MKDAFLKKFKAKLFYSKDITDRIDIDFNERVEYEEKLNEFLDFVIKNVDSEDGIRLIVIAQRVWMEYVNNEVNDDSPEELTNFGN